MAKEIRLLMGKFEGILAELVRKSVRDSCTSLVSSISPGVVCSIIASQQYSFPQTFFMGSGSLMLTCSLTVSLIIWKKPLEFGRSGI